jgi:hypothetical protein
MSLFLDTMSMTPASIESCTRSPVGGGNLEGKFITSGLRLSSLPVDMVERRHVIVKETTCGQKIFSCESFCSFLMASTSTIKSLSLHGKGLKLNTREDVEPYLKDIDPTLLEEIHLGGNTIGVEASQALAEFLSKTQVLKVRKKSIIIIFFRLLDLKEG